jgi:predicted outer membrane protein
MKMWKAAALSVVGSTAIISAALSQQAQPQTQPQAQPQPRPGVQVQVNPNRPGQPQSQSQAGQSQGHHHQTISQQSMAACVAIANQEEIALARLAADKTKNEEVQKFAKMVIEDHQKFLKKLERFTPEARHESLQTASAERSSDVTTADIQLTAAQERPRQDQDQDRDQDRQGQAQPQRQPQAQPQRQPQAQGQQGQTRQPQQQGIQQTGAQAASGSVDLLQLEREVAQQCLNDSKKKLSEKEGAEFDACFMGQQAGKHAAMATKLTVLKRHASGEFAEVLDEGLKTTESHLEEAEKILDSIVKIEKSDASSRSNDRNPERDTNRNNKE